MALITIKKETLKTGIGFIVAFAALFGAGLIVNDYLNVKNDVFTLKQNPVTIVVEPTVEPTASVSAVPSPTIYTQPVRPVIRNVAPTATQN